MRRSHLSHLLGDGVQALVLGLGVGEDVARLAELGLQLQDPLLVVGLLTGRLLDEDTPRGSPRPPPPSCGWSRLVRRPGGTKQTGKEVVIETFWENTCWIPCQYYTTKVCAFM